MPFSLALLAGSVLTALPVVHAINSPPNAVNITVIGLRPANLSSDLNNKDTADAAGDLFFYIGDRMPQPLECREKPQSPMCNTVNITHHDQVYTKYILEVDSTFGGCPSGDRRCTKYTPCNPATSDPTGATWRCIPQRPDVGIANVTQRYPYPQGREVWDQWKFEASKLLGGLWFSTQKAGNCDDASATDCKWRIVQEVKTVKASCANDNVHQAVVARNSTCFGACSPADKLDPTSDCFIRCFFGTILSQEKPMAAQDLVRPFAAAFESDDPTKHGCPAL